jgi:hypothetical protein
MNTIGKFVGRGKGEHFVVVLLPVCDWKRLVRDEAHPFLDVLYDIAAVDAAKRFCGYKS